MKKIVIFAGTTEGRALSDMLAKEKTEHTVCVATEYGRSLMDEGPYTRIRTGRMDRAQMAGFLAELAGDEGAFVIDATHPYASEATGNIKSAAAEAGVEYIRVVRDRDDKVPETVRAFDDMSGCAKAVDETEGNILLTTGSKELAKYLENVSDGTRARTYVRILPSPESLDMCLSNGIEPEHVIAMQGPFCREMNKAVIKQFGIRHLITKDSGAAGGFAEKIEAAAEAGVQVYVISRPCAEEGVSVSEAIRLVTGKDAGSEKKDISITLIGIGPGGAGCLTSGAEDVLAECDIVFGAGRLLQGISHPRKYDMYLADEIIPVLEKEQKTDAAIVFSGDTGFSSGAKKMLKALKNWRSDIGICVMPGISSFSYLAAALQVSYDDACLVSLHGKNTEPDLYKLAEKVRYSSKTFVLISGEKDIPRIAKKLKSSGIEGYMAVGTNLSYEDEKITKMSFAQALEYSGAGLACLLIVNDCPCRRPLIRVIKDDELIREKTPMTKECIRHESIIRMGIREDDVVFDIGGGTGSVAIEAAMQDPGVRVFTIEKDAGAAGLIQENVKKAGTDNVTVLEGDAADLLPGMEKPDCVFIGGSGGRLRDIVAAIRAKGSGIRFVINAVTLETVNETWDIIREYGAEDEEAVMISVSCAQTAGSYHMLRAQNPVWIFSFTL
ncbi:MAG: precorrin-6A reductase [Lachnospiraceae bacterium]|nr:precorrin-6A reductase [Lachnospiraceae bacterium]